MKSVTFKFWITLEFSRRHCNLKPKRFDFCIENKLIDRTCPFHYQRLGLFGLLEEIDIKSSVAFLKCFSILSFPSVVHQIKKSVCNSQDCLNETMKVSQDKTGNYKK